MTPPATRRSTFAHGGAPAANAFPRKRGGAPAANAFWRNACGSSPSCAQWLSWRCSITPGAARERMRVAAGSSSFRSSDRHLRAGRSSPIRRFVRSPAWQRPRRRSSWSFWRVTPQALSWRTGPQLSRGALGHAGRRSGLVRRPPRQLALGGRWLVQLPRAVDGRRGGAPCAGDRRGAAHGARLRGRAPPHHALGEGRRDRAISAGDPLDYSIAVEGLIMRELPDP